MSGILRQFVALEGIQHHQQQHSTSREVEPPPQQPSSSPSTVHTRPRRHAETNGSGKGNDDADGGGGGSATPVPPPATTTTKKTTVNPMKNRIYTSQINYPSVSGAGGRIYNSNGIGGSNSTRGQNATMDRERIRMEFYATYDVMTGIRIAATLSGFFAFVIILVMYKSRSHTNQALKDPKIVAVAAAVVLEEEERELQEKLDATGLSLYADDINYEYRRQRLLSLGGFDPALIDSPRRYSYGGVRPKYNVSRPSSRHSSSDVQTRYSYDFRDQYHRDNMDDEFIMVEQDEQMELENDFEEIEFRSYPQAPPPRANSYDSRRCSSITCCSTESSYLERRCSALTLGIYSIGPSLSQPPPPPSSSNSCQPHSHLPHHSHPHNYNANKAHHHHSPCIVDDEQQQQQQHHYNCSISDFEFAVPVHNQPNLFYPPSSTATISNSNRAMRSNSHRFSRRASSRRSSSLLRRAKEDATDVSVTLAVDTETGGGGGGGESSAATLKRTAPLASLSSFKISSMDQQGEEMRSLGSDSVFCENYVDTDEEVAQFSSDSCEEEGEIREERAAGQEVTNEECNNVFIDNNPIRELDSESIPMNDVNQGGSASVGIEMAEEEEEVKRKEEEEENEQRTSKETNALTERSSNSSSLLCHLGTTSRKMPEIGNITGDAEVRKIIDEQKEEEEIESNQEVLQEPTGDTK